MNAIVSEEILATPATTSPTLTKAAEEKLGQVIDFRDAELNRLRNEVRDLKLHNSGLKAQLLSLAKGRSEFLDKGQIAIPIPMLKELFLARFCRDQGYYNQGRTIEDILSEVYKHIDVMISPSKPYTYKRADREEEVKEELPLRYQFVMDY